ncbi:YhfC family intramembrane metalloprotease [Paenibacillus sp. Soil522]|uniref:YhfC family intramembrane metalloprotease n=1 Tax=Paenibacillus sp. Soil522 TaxID=1736388 RepID=UPI0006FBD09E|nr:YhfC family intramembrane metalloprotease [Paenibacillus sp. Soil522]KRE45491.1 hypothetical protein ASG81_12815 [Paenibacillus sp. Soil522]
MAMQAEQQDLLEGIYKRAIKFLPLYALVPVLYGVVFWAAGQGMDWKAFALGALGWVIALFLRGPVSLLAKKLPVNKAQGMMVASSGVLEESVRLALVALFSGAFTWAHSFGQGWAAVEVVFVIINVIVIGSLIKRTDEKAMQAKEFLQAQGTLNASPLWGVLERIWASAIHIGCTLIVVQQPWAVLLLIPLHSGINWFAVKLATKSVGISSLFIAVFGILSLMTGIMLY